MVVGIVALIIGLIMIVIVVSSIQQHKEKLRAEKRVKVAKQKAIIDECENLIASLSDIPNTQNISKILNQRCLNAAKVMAKLMPDILGIKKRIQELNACLATSQNLAKQHSTKEEQFNLPDNEQQLLSILQCIKKLRVVLKSEQKKGVLDEQTFRAEDFRLASIQLKINIESLFKRGQQAFKKEMFGSARQYFEKALQGLNNSSIKNDYATVRHADISQQLTALSDVLKKNNAKDAAKKAKNEADELDLLFQPKKKW